MLFFQSSSLPMRAGAQRLPIHQLRAGRVALALAAALVCGGALAQPSALMDACNAINDKKQRLACFKELVDLKAGSAQGEAVGKRVKSAFASVAGAVGAGMSYNHYAALILEPAKELEVFRREHPSTSPVALQLFDQALVAYRDAQKVWQANLYLGRDGGSFGRILDVAEARLGGIVHKHQLPLQTLLPSQPLKVDAALSEIWRYADQRARLATDVLEGRVMAADLPADVLEGRADAVHQATDALDGRAAAADARVTCDLWGNPKDAEGNPCKP